MSEPIAVIGGGRMGAGIAQVFAAAGFPVTVIESDERSAAAALERVQRGLRAAAAHVGAAPASRPASPSNPSGHGFSGPTASTQAPAGTRGEPAGSVAAVAEVRIAYVMSAIPADAVLVIEAVPEALEFKRTVLFAVADRVDDACVIASNTSSLSIDELAAGLPHPDRFLGMHFFNPVPVSALVEIVVGSRTDPETVRRASGWVAMLGKTGVVVRDSPGFASSRLGVLLALEAIRMLEDGVADAPSIDRVMELGYRHPMGPLRLTDLVGLDVRLAIAEYLHERLGDRFEPPELLLAKVARGELGRKTGRGFYDWPAT